MNKRTEMFKGMVNKALHGDCMDLMQAIPDRSIDLCITDPPYGTPYLSNQRYNSPQFEEMENSINSEFIKEVFRILKNDTHIYIFCNENVISEFGRGLVAAGFNLKRTLVWVKNAHSAGDLHGDYGNKTGFVLFAHKGRRELNGKRDTNILSFARVSQLRHPTEKPIDLLKYLIGKSSDRGDLIIDPFGGSFSTAMAAEQLGRRWISCDVSKHWYQTGVRRIKEYRSKKEAA